MPVDQVLALEVGEGQNSLPCPITGTRSNFAERPLLVLPPSTSSSTPLATSEFARRCQGLWWPLRCASFLPFLRRIYFENNGSAE